MKSAVGWLLGVYASVVQAGPAVVEHVRLEQLQAGQWRIAVTLRHEDAGWNHYADAWRVVDADGKELGRRILHHPHVDEQPFTRSLSPVTLPGHLKSIWVQAHDSVHGWNEQGVSVDLWREQGARYEVQR